MVNPNELLAHNANQHLLHQHYTSGVQHRRGMCCTSSLQRRGFRTSADRTSAEGVAKCFIYFLAMGQDLGCWVH